MLRKEARRLGGRFEFPKGGRGMRSYADPILNFLEAEDGPTAVEYAVMLALIVVVCITAIGTLGTNANKVFANAALNAAVSGSSS